MHAYAYYIHLFAYVGVDLLNANQAVTPFTANHPKIRKQNEIE